MQETLPHYRVPFFEALKRELAARKISLTLVIGSPSAAIVSKNDQAELGWARPSVTAHGASVVFQLSRAMWKRYDLVILEQANRHVANYLYLLIRIFGGPRVAFWGHGANLQHTSPAWSERLKARMLPMADWFFAYTTGSRQLALAAGCSDRQITVVQNSIDVSQLVAARGSIVRRKYRCVFIGSLYEQKRIDFLLKAAEHIFLRNSAFELLILGDGPLRSTYLSPPPRYVNFLGVSTSSKKVEAMLSSSLVLMPGLVGLAAVDSFAAEAPIVTTAVDYHSPEFEYLENDRNAIILARDCNSAQFAEKVLEILDSESYLSELRSGCRVSSQVYTLGQMVERFVEGAEEVLRSSR